MQKRTQGAIAAAAAVAIALTSLATVPADAAARKHHVTRHYYRGGNAAAFGMFAATLGTIATLAARDRYTAAITDRAITRPIRITGHITGRIPIGDRA